MDLLKDCKIEKNLSITKTEKEEILLKAKSLKENFWGASFYFDFIDFFSVKSDYDESLRNDNAKFNDFLMKYYKIFHVKKSKIYKIVYEIFASVSKKNSSESYIEEVAVNLILLLNKVIFIKKIKVYHTEFNILVTDSKILSDFFLDKLIEKKVIFFKHNNISFCDKGVSRYFKYSSSNFFYFHDAYFREIYNKYPNETVFDSSKHYDPVKIKYIEKTRLDELFLKLEKKQKKLNKIKLNFLDPETNCYFSDFKVAKKYNRIMIESIIDNDLLFNHLFISLILSGIYFSSRESPADNMIYIVGCKN